MYKLAHQFIFMLQ